MYIYANIFLSSSMYEKIRLICRPWKKPEGSLNRPMLKLLLESHLTYIMTNPGVSEADIIRKFSPHLQPIVVKEVIEVCMYIDHLNFQLRENNQTNPRICLVIQNYMSRLSFGTSVWNVTSIAAEEKCIFVSNQYIYHCCDPLLQRPLLRFNLETIVMRTLYHCISVFLIFL